MWIDYHGSNWHFYPWYIIRRAWSIVVWKAVTTYNPSSRKYTASWVWKCCRGFSASRPSGIKTSYPTPHRHQDNLIAEPSLLAVFRHSSPPPRSVARMTALVSLLSIFGKMLVSSNISFRKRSLTQKFFRLFLLMPRNFFKRYVVKLLAFICSLVEF